MWCFWASLIDSSSVFCGEIIRACLSGILLLMARSLFTTNVYGWAGDNYSGCWDSSPWLLLLIFWYQQTSAVLSILNFDGCDFTKTLGLAWDPVSDQMLFLFSTLQSTSRSCRHSVLSAITRFYDPPGLVSPLITSLAQDSEWQDIFCRFVQIRYASFPRFALSPCSELEIHGFCHDSIEAYEDCAYGGALKIQRVANRVAAGVDWDNGMALSFPKSSSQLIPFVGPWTALSE